MFNENVITQDKTSFYKDNNLDYELTGKLTFKSKEKSGKTDILVNKKDPNEFYAFGPLK